LYAHQDIFRVVDIVCCIAILVPILWSIRHLKEASSIDGKAAKNLEKLKMFRHFYLIVVSYIYFTRIIVYLLDATLPFRWTWFGVFVSELATLAFYFTTGYVVKTANRQPEQSLHELCSVG
jgi:G protein-coupled receptor 107